MCEITMALMAASTAMQAFGQMQQQRAAAAQAQYQAQMARHNAELARRQAEHARIRGGVAVDQARLENARLRGTQIAAFAASGVDPTSGSPLGVIGDTAALGAIDAETIRSNHEREAWEYEVQASNFGAEAGLRLSQASAARAMTPLLVGQTLLGSAPGIVDRWRQYRGSTADLGGAATAGAGAR